MNNKGQFSIIAALLVAVILITTVIVTYSTIRSSPVQNQPPILSAIDETNLAIKQILGFAIGYYDSVLQVTGNVSYAKTSAADYLHSGLLNIANMNPQWGTSLNLTSFTLQAYWFTSTSYSSGNLTVNYDLAGLGIRGINYQTSCELSARIMNSSTNGQAYLNIAQDDNDPLVTLGKENFNFYRYNNASSTWELLTPNTQPTSYSNGTYQVNPPSGVNSTAYVVQVKDKRGIIVVASSFNSYDCALTWNCTPTTSAQTLFAHQETTTIGGTSYYLLKNSSADASGTTLNNSTVSTGRKLMGRSVYPLTGVSSIQASMWTVNYRAWTDPSITFDSSSSGNNGAGLSSIQWTHTTGSSPNRIMVVGVSIRASSTNYVSNITYESQNLTLLRTDINNNGIRSEIWYLLSPVSGTAQITVSLATGSSRAVGGSCTYAGVDQTSPIDAQGGGTGSSNSPSQIIMVNTANDILLGNLAIRSSSSTVSEGSSQTMRWDNTSTGNRGHGSDERPLAVGSQSMNWTLSSSADWAVSAIALKPAPFAHVDTDILIRQSNGTNRATIATNVAASANLTPTPTTLSGTYSWANYTVADQNDWLEIDYYVDVTVAAPGMNVYLRIDDNAIAINNQTGVTNIFLLRPAVNLYSLSRQGTVVVELLQNGTMHWLGQNLALTNPASPMPFPPVPVRSIHVNETINGMNSEVPFQIEDWSSAYRTPLGLTGNMSLFNSRTMLVFLATPNVSMATIWWNGSDMATQTPLAFNGTYFMQDDTVNGILSNGNLKLLLSSISLYVDSFSSTFTSWKTSGASPYLNGAQSNYIYDNVNNDKEGWFTFQDLPTAYSQLFASSDQGIGATVSIDFNCTRNSPYDDYFQFLISNGTTTYGPYTIIPPNSNQGYNWVSYDISNIINTVRKVNNATVEVIYVQGGSASSNVYIGDCRLSLNFWLTSVYGNSTVRADFLRVNSQNPTYGSKPAYTINHGIIRDVICQEAEWSNGISNCADVYSEIVITLPANATYYSYQLRLIFVNSTQSRNVSDLCPIRLTTQISQPQIQTENGTLAGLPQNVTTTSADLFYNFSDGNWAHHWSQFISGTTGAGIMFTDSANQNLYVFDSMTHNVTGSLQANSTMSTIQLLPVTTSLLNSSTTLNPGIQDITWYGAVATFGGTTPIYNNSDQTGLWMIVEYPPTVAVTAQNY